MPHGDSIYDYRTDGDETVEELRRRQREDISLGAGRWEDGKWIVPGRVWEIVLE